MKKFEYKRFHVHTGPVALFERVRFVLREARTLKVHAGHFLKRSCERDFPLSSITPFSINDWELITVEVRNDSGKFVKTAWKRTVDGRTWWIVIGFHDTVQTVYSSDANAIKLGFDIITSGALYNFVEKVNSALMRDAIAKDKRVSDAKARS